MSDDPCEPNEQATDVDTQATGGKAKWRLRNVTSEGEKPRQKWMKAKAEEIDRALGMESDTFASTDNGGFVQRGAGYVIMGLEGPETTPPPMPPEAELRKAAEAWHNYPDLAQAPLREQFDDDAAFGKALIAWLVNVAPVVVRRNKQRASGRRSAKDIIAAARAQRGV